MSATIPQYILDRGDYAREYRRRSSCISRTSDSSTSQEPVANNYFSENSSVRYKEPITDLANYQLSNSDSGYARPPFMHKNHSDKLLSTGNQLGLDSDAHARKKSEPTRQRFGVARPTLVHM
ncbi:hypothetical protein LPJ78_002070 [Coemansia sp. RSA 989]|nr:hypothetical protein LPJ78_002070 [Coemansia sp. RSA 989]